MGKVQGYGQTEDGNRGTLLEATVTVIDNDMCKKTLRYNWHFWMNQQWCRWFWFGRDKNMLQFNLLFICRNNTSINQGDLAKALPFGLSYGMICSQVTDQKSSKTSISCAHLAGNLQRETLQRRLQGRRRRSLNSGGGRSYNRNVNKPKKFKP